MVERKTFLPRLSIWLPLLMMISVSSAFVTISPRRSIFGKDVMRPESLPPRTTIATSSERSSTRLVASINANGNEMSPIIEATAIAEEWIQKFSEAMSSGRIDDVIDLFVDDPEEEYVGPLPEGKSEKQFPPFWRDMVAYTWNIVTLEGKDSIRDMLEATMKDEARVTSWKLAEQRPSGRDLFPHHKETGILQCASFGATSPLKKVQVTRMFDWIKRRNGQQQF